MTAARPVFSALRDGARLALGTLTAVPVPAPRSVEAPVPGIAMALAPFAGLVPAVAAGAVVFAGPRIGAGPWPTAVLALAMGALTTRAIHLDGLADTADALTSGYDRERALTVMRSGGSGPAGIAALVLTLMLQASVLAQLVAGAATAGTSTALSSTGAVAAFVMTSAARLALPILCRRGVPAARPEGLGAMVAGSVGPGALAMTTLAVAALEAAALSWAGASLAWALAASALVLGVVGATAWALGRRCIRRLGGVTGDVLGCGVELGSALGGLALLVLIAHR